MKRHVNRILAVAAAAVVLTSIASWAASRFGAPRSAISNDVDGALDSSKYVSASVDAHAQQAAMTLHIAPGWHVNANPASFEYLIATVVSFEGAKALREEAKAVYPPGKDSGIVLDGKHISVYEDGTVIPFSLPIGIASTRIVVRVQACSTKGICLPPADVSASVNRI